MQVVRKWFEVVGSFLHGACRARMYLVLACLGVLPGMGYGAEEIVFGQVASPTNPASSANAKGLTLGIQVYFDKVNAKSGGVHGAKLKLRSLDDGLQNQKMLELTEELIADKSVLGLLGFLNSGGLAEIAKRELPAKHKIALIAPLQGDKQVVEAQNVFPLRSGYADEVRALLGEAKTWGKTSVAVVSINIAFGPALARVAQESSAALGLQLVANPVVDVSPDKIKDSVQAAVAAVIKAQPKAVLLLATGGPAIEFIQAYKGSADSSAQVYGISVLLHDVLVKGVGLDRARGIVLSQAVPFPFVPSLPIITQYQADMKKYAPGEAFSFSTLEGYLGAAIAVDAARRAGPRPTRTSLLDALNNMGELDLGGVFVHYKPAQRRGWGRVDLSIINASGNLQK